MINDAIALSATCLSIGLAAKLLLEIRVKPNPVAIPIPVKTNEKQ